MKKNLMMAMALGLLATGSAMADQASGVSTASKSSFLDKINLSYFGVLYGPGFNGISQPSLSDGSPNAGGAPALESFVFAKYNINDAMTIGPAIHFFLNAQGGGTIPGAALAEGAAAGNATFAFADPFIEFTHKKLVDTKGVNLTGQLRAYIPSSSFQQGEVTAFRTNQILTYTVPNTKLTLSDYSFVKYSIFSGPTAGYSAPGKPMTDVVIHVAPNATYQFHPKVAATLWVDAVELGHKYGTTGMSLINDDMDIEPGINWDVTDKLSLNPYINIPFLSTNILGSMQIGVIISAKIL